MANKIDFNNMSIPEREFVLNEIDTCLKIAGQYNGSVFGGYIRDVIAPRSFHPTCDVKFKDVDMWFLTGNDADRFVEKMGGSFVLQPSFNIPDGPYQFHMFGSTLYRKYHLYKHGMCLALIDIVVCDSLPVNDFSVNLLTAYYGTDTRQLVFRSWNGPGQAKPKPVSDIMYDIRKKQTEILPHYVDLALKHGSHLQRILCNYVNKGWTIKYQDQEFKQSSYPAGQNLTMWLLHVRESHLRDIYSVIKTASDYDGRVIGDSLINIFIPRVFDENCISSPKDVSLWFDTQKNADEFVAKMGNSFNETIPTPDHIEYQCYP